MKLFQHTCSSPHPLPPLTPPLEISSPSLMIMCVHDCVCMYNNYAANITLSTAPWLRLSRQKHYFCMRHLFVHKRAFPLQYWDWLLRTDRPTNKQMDTTNHFTSLCASPTQGNNGCLSVVCVKERLREREKEKHRRMSLTLETQSRLHLCAHSLITTMEQGITVLSFCHPS